MGITFFVLAGMIIIVASFTLKAKKESKQEEWRAEQRRLIAEKTAKKKQEQEAEEKIKKERTEQLNAKLNSPKFMELAEKFVAQYVQQDKYAPVKIFTPNEIKVFDVIIKDELGYVIDHDTLFDYLVTLSTKLHYDVFNKKFTKENPNLSKDLESWVSAYVDTFENNLNFVELLAVKIEDLNIDCSKDITAQEIQNIYYSLQCERQIDDLDIMLINQICQKLAENWRYYYLIAHINREIEQRQIRKQAQQHKENMNGGGKIRKNKIDINIVDSMDGISFEKFLTHLFTNMNYKTEITQASNDQGADLIIEKLGERTVVQAKCYSSKVGNTAVQEVTGAKQYYSCTKAMVITNNYFTKSAIELGFANDVELKDRDCLINLLETYPVYAEDIFIAEG